MTPMENVRDSKGLRVALISVVVLAAIVGLLQLTPPCTEWRAWKASKQGPGIHTLELMVPPFFCIGSRQP
ncbi:MAG: hypothetical protein LC808_07935 [Actinobacteria bacterium]|nr:hypothetical protein [Actinomycetota bacterium]